MALAGRGRTGSLGVARRDRCRPGRMEAELRAVPTGKRHDNVLRDAEVMLADLKLRALSFEGTYLTAQGKVEPCLNLAGAHASNRAQGNAAPEVSAAFARATSAATGKAERTIRQVAARGKSLGGAV